MREQYYRDIEKEDLTMGNNLFGGLGGLGGGLSDALGGLVGGLAKSGIVPQDDPDVRIFNAQQEIADLQKQEAQLFSEVGRQVMDSEAASVYPQEADKLRLIRSNIAEAQRTIDNVQSEKQAQQEQAEQEQAEQEQAQQELQQSGLQSQQAQQEQQQSGLQSPQAQQAQGARTCPQCGAVNPEGVNFCQECGTKLGAPQKAFCTNCGAENAPGTSFCGTCGTKL
jgi:DNA repair exonuclease SbcCD ATPase subunit